MKRPRPAIRIAVLVAAVACLGLAMCARSKPTAKQAAPVNTQQVPPQETQPSQQPPAEQNGGSGTQMELEEGKMGKQPRDSFPATKAPGRLY